MLAKYTIFKENYSNPYTKKVKTGIHNVSLPMLN